MKYTQFLTELLALRDESTPNFGCSQPLNNNTKLGHNYAFQVDLTKGSVHISTLAISPFPLTR